MGNICVFCGKKLGLLDRYFFEVFKTKQTACKDCLERLSALSGPELEAEKERLLANERYLSEIMKEKASTARDRRRGRVAVWRPHLESITEDDL